MKVAITSTGPSLEARVDPRFGRCPHFLFVETDDFSFEAIENPSVTLGGGAGVQSAQLMAERGVKHVLTGSCGPNAHQVLSAAGIGVIVGCSGPVRDVIERFKAGNLIAANEPNVASHFGMRATPANWNAPAPGLNPAFGQGARGAGLGKGGGRGMAMGRRMGGGMGRRQTVGFAGGQSPPAGTGKHELFVLKQQAEALARQIQEIQQRIQEIEKKRNSRTRQSVQWHDAGRQGDRAGDGRSYPYGSGGRGHLRVRSEYRRLGPRGHKGSCDGRLVHREQAGVIPPGE